MRRKTKMSGLVSHTTPTSSYLSEKAFLERKLEKGYINQEELRRLACLMAISKKKTTVKVTVEIHEEPMKELKVKEVTRKQYMIKCWDKWIPCTEMQYNIAPECARKIISITEKTWG